MSLEAQNQLYPDVIPRNTIAAAISVPVMATDFKTAQFSILATNSLKIVFNFGGASGPFTVGETVTGGTSLATGVVLTSNALTGVMTFVSITGTFVAGETITGSLSTNTAVLTLGNAPSFQIVCYKSNQELPPNPSLPVSVTNQYSPVGFTRESDQAYFDSSTPYNPTLLEVNSTFNIEATGYRWVFVAIQAYISGILVKTDISLFSNHN